MGVEMCLGGCPFHAHSPSLSMSHARGARAGPAFSTMATPSTFAIVSGMVVAFTGPCPCRNKRNVLLAILITVLMPMVRCAARVRACEGERAAVEGGRGVCGCGSRRAHAAGAAGSYVSRCKQEAVTLSAPKCADQRAAAPPHDMRWWLAVTPLYVLPTPPRAVRLWTGGHPAPRDGKAVCARG